MPKEESISHSSTILSTPIEYLKGVGPQKAELLKKELSVFTFNDLLQVYPYRHIDRTQVSPIAEINPSMDHIQVRGQLISFDIIGERRGKRLVARLQDDSGVLELTWFQGITWIQKYLQAGQYFLVFGRVSFFLGAPQVVHPEMELITAGKTELRQHLEPIYPSTEKLKSRGLGGRQLGVLTKQLFTQLRPVDLPENLPQDILRKYGLMSRFEAFKKAHYPVNLSENQEAIKRLKFEELFIAQLRMQMLRSRRHRFSKGVVFDKVGDKFNELYKEHIPFKLTGAQKRVIREIRKDTGGGRQMNRLLQGDVGSGKTIVAVLTMLLAVDNGFQACLMAPTEILAQQHYKSISNLLDKIREPVALLTGSTRAVERRKILSALQEGSLRVIIGTHALIEDAVQYENLGLVIIDEQHRFGVAQRARLWNKAIISPHVLVMTATPIPRTLAMTAYGDLDYSVIDELPPGRQPIATAHRYENQRSRVMDFLKEEIAKGRQVYIIFPLIEESSKLDYENLMKGYENVKAYFPEPKYWISMVHGKQPAAQKELNMKRFVEHDTQILVSTTVIEVGVDVPNATVMVIESAEKFGLSQLHQLRGRVGRGVEKSYCILMTGMKIGSEARERIGIMVSTGNGFEIAEKDLELRGPGDIEGTRQSGDLNFRLADLVKDRSLLELAGNTAAALLEKDPELVSAENLQLASFLRQSKDSVPWSKIS